MLCRRNRTFTLMISFTRRCRGQFCHYMPILQNVTLDRLSIIPSAGGFSFLIEALRVSTFALEHFASHRRAVLSRFLLLQGAFRRGSTFRLRQFLTCNGLALSSSSSVI